MSRLLDRCRWSAARRLARRRRRHGRCRWRRRDDGHHGRRLVHPLGDRVSRPRRSPTEPGDGRTSRREATDEDVDRGHRRGHGRGHRRGDRRGHRRGDRGAPRTRRHEERRRGSRGRRRGRFPRWTRQPATPPATTAPTSRYIAHLDEGRAQPRRARLGRGALRLRQEVGRGRDDTEETAEPRRPTATEPTTAGDEAKPPRSRRTRRPRRRTRPKKDKRGQEPRQGQEQALTCPLRPGRHMTNG